MLLTHVYYKASTGPEEMLNTIVCAAKTNAILGKNRSQIYYNVLAYLDYFNLFVTMIVKQIHGLLCNGSKLKRTNSSI